MLLRCDACDKGDCNRCDRTVRAFIEPSGPDTYVCECYCNQRRREKAEADRTAEAVIREYRRRYGDANLEALMERCRG